MARDMIRGYCIKKLEPNTNIQSITLCADISMSNPTLSMTKMYGNVNSRKLLPDMFETYSQFEKSLLTIFGC